MHAEMRILTASPQRQEVSGCSLSECSVCPLQVLAKIEEANQIGRNLPPEAFYNELIRCILSLLVCCLSREAKLMDSAIISVFVCSRKLTVCLLENQDWARPCFSCNRQCQGTATSLTKISVWVTVRSWMWRTTMWRGGRRTTPPTMA